MRGALCWGLMRSGRGHRTCSKCKEHAETCRDCWDSQQVLDISLEDAPHIVPSLCHVSVRPAWHNPTVTAPFNVPRYTVLSVFAVVLFTSCRQFRYVQFWRLPDDPYADARISGGRICLMTR